MHEDYRQLFSDALHAPLASFLKSKVKLPFLGLYVEYDFFSYAQKVIAENFAPKVSFVSVFNPNFPTVFRFNAVVSLNDKTLTAGSVDFDKETAESKVVGEFLERLSLFLPLKEAKSASFDRQKTTFLYKKKILVKNALTGLPHFIPSSRIYYGLIGSHEKNYQETTNGGAGYFTYDKAVLSGWLEIIQRDAFFVYWLNTITPKKIDISELDTETSLLAKKIKVAKNYGLEVHFIDLTSDIPVPVCGCVLVDRTSGQYNLAFGASSGFFIEEVLLHAFSEALSIISSKKPTPYNLPKEYLPFSDYELARQERAYLYRTKDGYDHAQFLFASQDYITPREIVSQTVGLKKIVTSSQQLEYLSQVFKKRKKKNKDYNVFIARIKNEIVDKLQFFIVKVVCDGLYPMYLREGFANPNHPRLDEFIRAKKIEKIAKRNTFPHPFL